MKNNIENENDYLNRRKMAEELSDLLLGRSESDEETELGNFLRSEERRAKLIDRGAPAWPTTCLPAESA